jgi:hypothetical protein
MSEINNFGPAPQAPVDPQKMAQAQHAIEVGEIIEIGRLTRPAEPYRRRWVIEPRPL